MSNVASETLETEQKIVAQTRPNVVVVVVVVVACPVVATVTCKPPKRTLRHTETPCMALKDELVREAHPKNV